MNTMQITAYMTGIATYAVGLDAEGEPTVWRQEPDAEYPTAILRMVDLPADGRTAHWAALTGHLRTV